MTKNSDDKYKGADSGVDSPSDDAVAILDAALLHVPFDGWGRDALVAGAADIGLDAAKVDEFFQMGLLMPF